MFNKEAYEKRVEWYQHDRFGMFIHWGLYAIPARGEWVRSVEQMPKEEEMGQGSKGGGHEICSADRQAS